ncbi:MAG TPA: hypothetical protein VGJ16_13035 [Pirellulales bacterium]|jgi:poly(3-hydroxybutyrate) depolymerase
MRLSIARLLAGCAMLFGLPISASASEAQIVEWIEQFFATSDASVQRDLADKIAVDPAYDRSHVSAWLHQARLFQPIAPGQQQVSVALPHGARGLLLRIPTGYDPARAWPVLYALHGTGGDADSIVRYLEQLLGAQIEQFVVAAPDQYEDFVVQDRFPPTQEHFLCLREVRKRVHVDSDRVYVTGYSRGGHASWTLSILCPDEFAGAMPLSGTLLLPEVDAFWPDFIDATAHLRILAVWGAEDRMGYDGKPSPQGGIAKLNRDLAKLVAAKSIDARMVELPGVGHGGVAPSQSDLTWLLGARREHFPATTEQTFRELSQARAYWLEGLTWTGPQWTDQPLRVSISEIPAGMSEEEAGRKELQREYRSRFGKLGGSVEGQTVRVHRKQLSEVNIWVSPELLDVSRPVTVYMSGAKIFEGTLAPDLLTCLTRAQRTHDLDRLYWCGVHFKSGGKAAAITLADGLKGPAR